MMKKLILAVLFLLPFNASASLLVLEAGYLNDSDTHAQDVSDIACLGLSNYCVLMLGGSFGLEDYADFKPELSAAKVVNLSLAYQLPSPPNAAPDQIVSSETKDYSQLLTEYKERSEVFEEMIPENQNILFLTAAGNGFYLGAFKINGIPISDRFPVYPAFYDFDNQLVVTSLDTDRVEIEKLDTYKIATYGNYSVFSVDVAAPVEKNRMGKVLKGTSFATPFVSRLAYTLMARHPSLTPLQVKELLIKSSSVTQLDRAIEVTKDWLENGEDSMLARLEITRKKKVRDTILTKLGGVILTKSGGPLVSELAEECAHIFHQGKSALTIQQACLAAHAKILEADQDRLAKLSKLWHLRGL